MATIIPNKQRVYCFVDGYNLYYSLFNFAEERDKKEWVWCDLYQLVLQFIDEEIEEITKVYYCSSMYHQDDPQRKVQQAFMNYHKEQYTDRVFTPVWGQFKRKIQDKKVKCPDCGHEFDHPFHSQQEKKTDINIAVLMLQGAYEKFYDKAILISGDTDFLPVLDHLKHLDKSLCKGYSILIPPGQYSGFGNHAKQVRHIKKTHLKRATFPPPAGVPEPAGLI